MLEGDSHAGALRSTRPTSAVLLDAARRAQGSDCGHFRSRPRASGLADHPPARRSSGELPDRHEGFVDAVERGQSRWPDQTTRCGSRSTKTRAARSSISSGAMASCGSWAMGRSASCMSFTATCAATTSPSNCSTTTSPPRPRRCRACRPRRLPPSPNECLEEDQWPAERAQQAARDRPRQLPQSRRAGARRVESRSPRLGIDPRSNPQAGQLDRGRALQPRVARCPDIIRADQLSRSAHAQVSGTVDIIGSTQRFQSYPAYEQLKNEFS